MKTSSSPKTKTASKSKPKSPKQNVLLPVTFYGEKVYVDTVFCCLRLKTPRSKLLHPMNVATEIINKTERRNFRKALHAISPKVAALSVPSHEQRIKR